MEDVETFAYTASHDLQTPLRTFGSYAQLLLADYGEALDADGRELCEAIVEDALHMKTLLDSLQEYASLGCDAVALAAVSAQAELTRALQGLKSDIDQTGALCANARRPAYGFIRRGASGAGVWPLAQKRSEIQWRPPAAAAPELRRRGARLSL